MLMGLIGAEGVGGGGGTTYTTFDAATLSNVTLSGGDLVATHSSTADNSGATGVAAHAKSSGKYYWEITGDFSGGAPGNFAAIGALKTTGTYTNVVTNGTNCLAEYFVGSVWSNNASQTTNTGTLSGAYGIAFDLDNNKAWIVQISNGLWFNQAIGSQNPATNTGGVPLPSAASWLPVCCFGGAGTAANAKFTANFGASAFSGSAPSGFTSGWPV